MWAQKGRLSGLRRSRQAGQSSENAPGQTKLCSRGSGLRGEEVSVATFISETGQEAGGSEQGRVGYTRKALVADFSRGSKRKWIGASLLFNPLTRKGGRGLLPGLNSCVLYTRQ